MKTLFRGAINLIEEKKKNTFSFILNKKEYQQYFEEIKGFVNVIVERKVAFQVEAINILTLHELLKNNANQLSYKRSESLFVDISEQIKILESMGYGYLSIHPNDILLIESDENNFSFIFLNIENHYSVEKNILEITKPYKKHDYFSPQIKTITQIPTKINYSQNIYYSLATVVCNCLDKIDPNSKYVDYQKHLDCILETKLYWALLRCLQDKPEERFCLFI